MTTDRDYLKSVAQQCVELVSSDFGRELDWSLESLTVLDGVCESLRSEGPLSDERLDLWFKLVGAYTGQVLIETYGGEWVEGSSPNSNPAVATLGGVTAHPFAIANKVLLGEDFKSLASFGRAVPVIASRDQH